MYTFDYLHRVRYADTDQMGYVYYGRYAEYFEAARVEALRHLGVSYKKLEERGVMMPVLEHYMKYYKPALYDEELTIKVMIKEMPMVRFRFDYDVYNQLGQLINQSYTTLVFVQTANMKSHRLPEEVKIALSPYFN
jgi:acyl-CoA thioester hydrolase